MVVIQQYTQPGGEVREVVWSHVLAFCYWGDHKDDRRIHILTMEQVLPYVQEGFLNKVSLSNSKRAQIFVSPVYKDEPDCPYSVFAKVEQGITVKH